MELIRMPDGGRPLIQGYGDHGFRISGQRVEGAVLVLQDRAEQLSLAGFDEIGAEQVHHLTALEDAPDVLLIGAGAAPMALPAIVRNALTEAGIAVEVMGTGAACRTYNVLVGEGRRVAALLLPVE